MSLIYIAIGIISLIAYLKERHLFFLLCYMALMTNLFMLLPYGDGLRGSDVALVCTFILYFHNKVSKSNHTGCLTVYEKFALSVIVFSLIELVICTLLDVEILSYAAKVIRIPLLISGVFIIKTIPLSVIYKFMRYALCITLLDCFLFYLEFVGIDTLPNVDPLSSLTTLGFSSSCNIPVLTIPFLILCFSKQIRFNKKGFCIIFLLGIVALSFVRTYFIAVLVSVVLFLVMQKIGKKQIILFLLLGLCVIPVFSSLFSMKENGSSSTKQDLVNIINGDFLDPLKNEHAANGTYSFRMSMLAERVQYLINNPEYVLLGVGPIHEGSPRNKFHFIVGTRNDRFEKCMIESGDITWVPTVLRYGIIGTMLYLSYFLIVYIKSKNRRDCFLVFAPIALCYFIMSFSGSFFEVAEYYLVINLVLGILARVDVESLGLTRGS